MDDQIKKPLTQEELTYIRQYLNGNVKKAKKREDRFVNAVEARNECLASIELLAKLPGTEQTRHALMLEINKVKVLELSPDDFKKAKEKFQKTGEAVRKALASHSRTGLAKEIIGKQNAILKSTLPMPPGRAAEFEQEVSRGILHGGAGPKFKKVTAAMKEVEKNPSEPNLAAVELAARTYLNGYDEDDQANDAKTQRKAEICRNALLDVAAQRKHAQRLKALGTPPWNAKEETAARALQAEMLLDRKPAAKLGAGESGASESFFIPDKSGGKAFIFKPGDGENVSGYGWQVGGGAPREVMVSAVNEKLKESGLDCGVGRTSLMRLDHPSIATPQSGGHTQRVGAAQDFVPSNRKTLADYNEYDEEGKRSCALPKNEVQKVLLLDFVTLQLDRNDGNLLFQDGEDGKGRAVPIDAGNALPTREAFESKRRAFTAGALFQTDHAAQPFSPEMLSSIENMDPEKIAESMAQTNQVMGQVDPNAPGMIPPETIEMVRRSILFLKKAAGELKSPQQLGEAYQYTLQKVFDAPPDKIEQAIEAAIKETKLRAQQFAELEQSNWRTVLRDLGWPVQKAEFSGEDPAYLLSLMKNQRPNPAAQKEVADLTQALGGPIEAAKLIPSFGQGTLYAQLAELRTTLHKQGEKPEVQLQRENGDAVLQQASVDATNMTPQDKATAVWKILYDQAGGDVELERLRSMGFVNIQSLKNGGAPVNWVPEMRAWQQYEQLGGGRRHVQLGGSGPPGPDLTPVKLLDNLKTLESVFAVRRDEVKQGLVQAQQFILAEDVKVQKLLSDAQVLFDEAQDLGGQLPDLLSSRNAGQVEQICQQIDTRSSRLKQMIEQAKIEEKRIEDELFKILPDADVAARFGERPGRKQIIENGLYRLQNALTSERGAFPNYARWLEEMTRPIRKASLSGGKDPLIVYRLLAPNDAKKLSRQEWPPIGGADARISELLKAAKLRIDDATSKGATPERLQLIQLDFGQLDQELLRTTGDLDAFDRRLAATNLRYPPHIHQMASKAKPAKEDEDLVNAMKDLDAAAGLAQDTRQHMVKHAASLHDLRELYVALVPLPSVPTRPTGATTGQGNGGKTDTATQTKPTPVQGGTTSSSQQDAPQQPQQPQRQEKKDTSLHLEEELLEPAEPQILDESAANPTLYFQPNTAKGKNYVVNSLHPGGQWQKVEQFCAYLAADWLANSPGGGGLKFSGLGDKQAAIRTLIQWGAEGGLNAQVDHARSTLKGNDLDKDGVIDRATKGSFPIGTKIWFGSNAHAQAAFVRAADKYAVYDPNSGKVAEMSGAGFANYAQQASAFVVA